MNAKKLFGMNLKNARLKRGISQQQLALDVEIDPAYVGRIERGLENVSIGIMETIAVYLQMEMSEMFRLPDPNETAPPPLKVGRKPKAQ